MNPSGNAFGAGGAFADIAHGTIRDERYARGAAVAMFHDGLMGVQVESRHDRAAAVRCRQCERLPPARRQPQGGVLQLRLGRGELDGQLAEELSVRVQGVAGLAPAVVRERGQRPRHAVSLCDLVGR